MKFWKQSLLIQLVSSFLILSLITISLVGYLAFNQAKQSLIESVFERLNIVVSLKEDGLQNWLFNQTDNVLSLAELPQVNDRARILLNSRSGKSKYQQAQALLQTSFTGFLKHQSGLQKIFILTEGGKVLASTDSAQIGKYQPLVQLSEVTPEGKDNIKFNFYRSLSSEKPLITLETPIIDASGQRIGMLAADLNLDRIDRIIRGRVGLGETGETYLVANVGSSLSGKNVFVSSQQFGSEEFPNGINSKAITDALGGNNGRGLYKNYRGIPTIGVYRWLPDRDVASIGEISQREAFAPANQLAKSIWLNGMILSGIVAIGIFLLALQITQPIMAITDTARLVSSKVQRRNYSSLPTAPDLLNNKNEIGVLCRTFNQMTRELESSHKQLEESLDELANYSHTLEQKVEERTKELSQTVEILQATQAELIFENTMLKTQEESSAFDYQVGGSLPMNSPTYVVRSADRYLYKQLKRGEFCYILNPRQVGKSSLMVRMMHHLQHEGVSCGAIDMTRIGSTNVTIEQWYKSSIVELWRCFGLLKTVNLKSWLNENRGISPVQQLSQFIEEVLLVKVKLEDGTLPKKIVIFIDEIDSILGLNFSVDDFFCMIRSFYNRRTIDRNYQRLTFVLLGVATPNNLMKDYRKTPFNIGKLIKISGFKEHEAQPLLAGLKHKINNPQTILKEVLAWTGGQPFLTQKVCKIICDSDLDIPANGEVEWIENSVRINIIQNWESKDEPEHLRTVRDRILNSDRSLELLELYRKILNRGEIKRVDTPQEEELLLSGIAIEQDNFLRVHNRIYQLIFDLNWVELHLARAAINSDYQK